MAATVASAPGLPSDASHHADTAMVGTIPDPRSRHATPKLSPSASPALRPHPDLNTEVAMLSNKLINAINQQTHLDDSLAATRHELEASRERVRQLETEAREHADLLSRGVVVNKNDYNDELYHLSLTLADERRQRSTAEKEKKSMELELETLTTALFEEANTMVAAARRERDATERKNEQLRAKMSDVETLLASHQEQLSELKSVMQQMSSDREDLDTSASLSTAPTTPSFVHPEHPGKMFEALALSPNASSSEDLHPAHPLAFGHLLQPVLRTDLQAYEDFVLLLHTARGSPAPSRMSSGAYGGLNVMGLNALHSPSTISTGPLPSNGSTSSINTVGTMASSPATPSTPASSLGSVSGKDASTPLKDTRFYKRVLVEDLEPTLRLDTAPGLSWLARRNVVSSMSDGSLVVEPIPGKHTTFGHPCALCHESRKTEECARRHRFKTSASEYAQRYPVCHYCLGRVRTACDFLGFLRMIKDGHWRTEGLEGEKGAWEECVRLRESMFWARIGGGVVPAAGHGKEWRRTSSTGERQDDSVPTSFERPTESETEAEAEAEVDASTKADGDHVFRSAPEPARKAAPTDEQATPAVEASTTEATHSASVDVTSLPPTDLDPALPPDASPSTATAAHRNSRGEHRLSITIPGSFE
ncbi:MAG: rab guanine nucleotide exchange factor S2 [Thelocarpon superellum]|nr:MAG: rab guanine nucleotide exchange factor S2 [Thelocarpon superellum]